MQTQITFWQSVPCCSMCKKDKNLQDWCLTTAVSSLIHLHPPLGNYLFQLLIWIWLCWNCSVAQMRHLLLVESRYNNTPAFYCIFSSYCKFDFWHLLLSNCSKNRSHRCGGGEIMFYYVQKWNKKCNVNHWNDPLPQPNYRVNSVIHSHIRDQANQHNYSL